MIKSLLLAFLLLALQSTMAQNAIDSVAFRAMQVGRVMQQERVFLHFDNTAYYLGETMWFKAYVSFGADNRPSLLSKVLYVELVAPEGYVVKTNKYKLDENGCCHGEFELDPLLLSGYYEVRAYTRYMLNWDKEAVFSRVFPVFDKVNADNWDFKNMLDRKRNFFQDGEWHNAELPDVTLDFFPESGHLVDGLPARVAFELREEDGLFSEAPVTIFKNGVKLLESVPMHLGKGIFKITPEVGAEYHATVRLKDKKGKPKEHRFSLPAVEKEGATISVDEKGDSIGVTIRSCFDSSLEMGFVVLHRGTMGFYRKLGSDSSEVRMSFAKEQLPEGVNRVLLFVDDSIPLAERQFFVMHDSLQKSGMETVKLRVLANGYHAENLAPAPNEKITLKVVREDNKPLPAGVGLSLSLTDAQGRQATSYSHNIYTYMLLGSEVKGYLPDAAQYFDPANRNRKEKLDLVMLTHGWTSYDWSKLASRKIKDLQPVERGITLKGRFLQKRLDTRMGHKGEVIITPQPYNLVRLDVANGDNGSKMSTFRTDSTASFVIEVDDFYGTRVASLKPQTAFRQTRFISYNFALDRYYSPGFRMYDHWERHLGAPMSKAESDSLVKLNPFEYMLSAVEVVGKKKSEIGGRPPHSEMRLNFLDEWEYAQDVTYLNVMERYRDAVYDAFEAKAEEHAFNTVDEFGNSETVELVSDVLSVRNDEDEIDKYVGYINYGGDDESLPVNHEYDHTFTAADVVKSAIVRHGYHWAYWVQLMVVQGQYSPFEVPVPDMEYLRGVPDVEKMTNFKEFVIRSDVKTREQFENRANYWTPLTFMLDNKIPVQKFYYGFLSQLYVYPTQSMQGCPNVYAFSESLTGGPGINYPVNPNYVACFIPYTPEERENALVPEFAATGSSMRYTMLQGYNESKKFYSPDYGNMKPQEKDYRRTLLWEPAVKVNEQGEAVIELYNSSVCGALNVSVEGRCGNTLFSNDAVMPTRELEHREEKAQENVRQPKKESLVVESRMDSVLESQCRYEHEKGVIYYNQKRYKNAIMIFAELVQYKYAPSLYYVGLCYRNGTGINKNDKLAHSFLLEAARYGEPRAQYELALCYLAGEGVERDEERGLEWLKHAVEQNEPRALLEMSQRYSEGRGVAQDSIVAAGLLAKSAELKLPQAMFLHGRRVIENGGEGLPYIVEAATQENVDAMLYMMDHEHEAGDFKSAYRYARKLSLLGVSAGTRRMADYYNEGKGVKRDRALAQDLYRQAISEAVGAVPACPPDND